MAAHLKAVREALNELKKSMTVGAPPMILTYHQVCEGVGFNKYWDLEEKYKYGARIDSCSCLLRVTRDQFERTG